MTPDRASRARTPATSPTAPTTSSASTTCATTWRGRSRSCVQRGHNFADRRRGRLDPHRRGPHAADHQRPGRRRRPSGTPSSPGSSPRLKRGDEDKGIDGDYEVDEKKRTVGILEPGVEKVEDWLGIDNLYESVNTPLVGYLNNAHQGQGAVQARQGLRRHERRGAHRRRAHRPHPRRPPLQRGHAPGDRGQGGRGDQGTRTRPSPRSPCRTTSASTTSSPA